MAPPETLPIVAGRACGTCTMCCKLLPIPELEKPRQTWCRHCDKARGCTIYETRPEGCAKYLCAYLISPALDERWKPASSRFIVHTEGDRVIVTVDADRPQAWRKEPFFSAIKNWARGENGLSGGVIVWEGPACLFLSGAREIALGTPKADQIIATRQIRTSAGVEHEVFVLDRDDPKLAALQISATGAGKPSLPGLPG